MKFKILKHKLDKWYITHEKEVIYGMLLVVVIAVCSLNYITKG
jgi:hypothetical protein